VTAYTPAKLELELPPEPTSVTAARAATTELARRVGAPEEEVALAVSEAVGNAVMHAFRGREGGTITVRARGERGRLIVTVTDDGIGMTPNLDSTGLGLGISLITKMALDVRFDASSEGTSVSMGFPTRGTEGKAA